VKSHMYVMMLHAGDQDTQCRGEVRETILGAASVLRCPPLLLDSTARCALTPTLTTVHYSASTSMKARAESNQKKRRATGGDSEVVEESERVRRSAKSSETGRCELSRGVDPPRQFSQVSGGS
jgi:hypothetical protein